MSEPTARLRVVRPDDAGADDNDPHRPRSSWAADELMAMEFAPPRWAVPGFLAEGVSLLAGPPKVGKSWLALDLAGHRAPHGLTLATTCPKAGPRSSADG